MSVLGNLWCSWVGGGCPVDGSWPRNAPVDGSWPRNAPADRSWPRSAPEAVVTGVCAVFAARQQRVCGASVAVSRSAAQRRVRGRQRRRRGRVPVRLMTLGVTRRSHVGRSSQRACQPPSSSCSSRMPGSQSAAVPSSGSTSSPAGPPGSSPLGRTSTAVTWISAAVAARPAPVTAAARPARVAAGAADAAGAAAALTDPSTPVPGEPRRPRPAVADSPAAGRPEPA